MDDDSSCDFPFFPGIDLTLWVQILVAVIVLALAGGLVAGLAG